MMLRIIFLLLLFSYTLYPDTLVLKNGQVIEDVKIDFQGNYLFATDSNGNNTRHKKAAVKSVKLKSVAWVLSGVKREDQKSVYEKERLRVANALMENTDWEIPESEKPRLAFIPFSAGSVSRDLAELYSGIIKTKVSKTGLFVVIDSGSIQKAMQNTNCRGTGCAQFIPPELRANKLLTGTVTSAGNFLFIQGDVVDMKTKKIDFSESILVEDKSKEGIEQATEIFAKKITGGTMSFLENQALQNPYKGEINKLPMIWRSALVPGWGQWRDESPRKAVAFFSASVVGIAGYGLAYWDMKKKQKEYDNYDGLPNVYFSEFTDLYYDSTYFLNFQSLSQRRNRLEKARRNVNNAAYFLTTVWAINLLDVVLFAEGEISSKKELKATVAPESAWNHAGMPGLNVSLRFSIYF